MPKRLTFRQQLDRYPPILLRLLVVVGHGNARQTRTDRDLAFLCKLTIAEFKFVSYSTAWDGPVMAYMQRYMDGLHVDLDSATCRQRLNWMRNHGRFSHLRNSPDWPQYSEMLEIWEESAQ